MSIKNTAKNAKAAAAITTAADAHAAARVQA